MGAVHQHGGAPCRFGSVRLCNQHWREFQHGHHGRRCRKGMVPSSAKKGEMVEACLLIERPERGMSFDQLVKAAGITPGCCQ